MNSFGALLDTVIVRMSSAANGAKRLWRGSLAAAAAQISTTSILNLRCPTQKQWHKLVLTGAECVEIRLHVESLPTFVFL